MSWSTRAPSNVPTKSERFTARFRLGDLGTCRYFFIRHNWNPSLAIDASITSRFRSCGGADSGRITPIACQGRNCAGSLLPPGSSENARRSGLVSDLKTKIRMGCLPAHIGPPRYLAGNAATAPKGSLTYEIKCRAGLLLSSPSSPRGLIPTRHKPTRTHIVLINLAWPFLCDQRVDMVIYHNIHFVAVARSKVLVGGDNQI